MTYKVGFDGVASAEVTHLLRAVQNGLNGQGLGMLTHVQAQGQDATASAASTVDPCENHSRKCENGKNPVEPPNVVVIALVVVVSLLIGLAVGYRLGKLAAPTVNRT